MIATIALATAGPGAHLVTRPHGRPHVYVGPLTRSGRHVPRTARPVCRAHTRRLTVMDPRETAPGLGVCARCAACLTSTAAVVRQAAPSTRDQYAARYAHLTAGDLVAALHDATTPLEVDRVAHLTLLRFGHTGCTAELVAGTSLHQHVTRRRRALTVRDPDTPDRLDLRVAETRAQRRAEWAEIREQRRDRLLHGDRAPRITNP